MPELDRTELGAFMKEVTGHPPFPWQQRLLHEVLDAGWPELLDLPTGTGKTSTLLVALYALALAPERMHRRIALVVDRRIIVDQVDGFAARLRKALVHPRHPVCVEVAARLRSLVSTPDADPVSVVTLRGGIPRDDRWLGRPDQPTIIASTVDQVGSRLLFRGYGVSESMRPVHAGLLAHDTLYLLDEVHLATAFEETLSRLASTYQGERWAERRVGRPLHVVRMSATPRVTDARPLRTLRLDDADRADPVLARRLSTSRVAELELVKTKRAGSEADHGSNRARVAEAACARARQALERGARAVGIVVNRVDTARRAAALLDTENGPEVLLVTGRMRPFDRLEIQEKLERAAAAGRSRDPDARPTVVVATSCIEAGADLDFDALVTEVASLDAVRQRFGRLDRLGHHEGRAPAWILGCSDQLSASARPDPIYGEALRHTWEHLGEIATDGRVDFGLAAFRVPAPDRLAQLLPPSREAPVMFPAYLDLWSETRPAPHPDPDPALWLHGKHAEPDRDVSVVFRGDVPDPFELDDDRLEEARDVVDFLPPVAEEAVGVEIRALVPWLRAHAPEGGPALAWRWTADGLEVIEVRHVRPGDTIVVPARWGGLMRGTWDPASTQAVSDVAELAAWRASLRIGGVAKLRLDRRTLPAWLGADVPEPPKTDDPEALEASHGACMAWMDALARRPQVTDAPWGPLLRALADPSRRRTLEQGPPGSGRGSRITAAAREQAVEATTEDAVSSIGSTWVTLTEHLADVEAWAGSFARAAGLPLELASDVALAGLLHDLGKADVRFQAILRGGDPVTAAGAEPMAKSPRLGALASRRRAEDRSGWPAGFRHELVSLVLLDASPELRARARDLELVRHLVASHHGWCRPWAPSVVDPSPRTVEVEVAGIRAVASTAVIDDAFVVECASRFRRLCRRYGWHGLAYLEALLRLGDHRASAAPRSRPGDGA
jgi:CRISPR-associated endonuclease/helicase Cas3